MTDDGGKPGYRNTDEPAKPESDEPPKEFPDQRGPDPDTRPPERAWKESVS